MARSLSSLECLLSVVSSLLLVCCAGLIVVSWISLKPEGKESGFHKLIWHLQILLISMLLFVCLAVADPAVLSGRMVIIEGAIFSEELKNSSSLRFKSLAFDVQHLVRPQAFILKTTGTFNLKLLAFIVKGSKGISQVLISVSVYLLFDLTVNFSSVCEHSHEH